MTDYHSNQLLFADNIEAKKYLNNIGITHDEDIDLIEAAFAFAMVEKPQVDIDYYRNYIRNIEVLLKQTFDDFCGKENSDDVHVMVKTLRHVMADDQMYRGDDIHYDDFKNINLCEVIDRRMGLPITLCILMIGLCRRLGWDAKGVNFPGHFIMRLEKDGERIMIDPFQKCTVLEAKDLRLILKKIVGEYAELSSEYYRSCENREILLRLQNNRKYRLIDSEDYQGALDIVHLMVHIAPDDHRLSLDKAVLLSRLDQPKAAIDEIKIYIAYVKDPYDKAEAERFLYQLQKQLN